MASIQMQELTTTDDNCGDGKQPMMMIGDTQYPTELTDQSLPPGSPSSSSSTATTISIQSLQQQYGGLLLEVDDESMDKCLRQVRPDVNEVRAWESSASQRKITEFYKPLEREAESMAAPEFPHYPSGIQYGSDVGPRKRKHANRGELNEGVAEKRLSLEQAMKSPVLLGLKLHNEMFFDLTMEYIRTKQKADWVYAERFGNEMSNVKTEQDFIQTVYSNSKPVCIDSNSTDEDKAEQERHETFWKLSKEVCVGMGNSITLGTTKASKTISRLMPKQFGGERQAYGGKISAGNQLLGAYGEKWVYNQLVEDNACVEQPGKIGKKSFLLATTTPDYLFFSGEQDLPETSPILFEEGAVVAIGECKSSKLTSLGKKLWCEEDATVKGIMEEHKNQFVRNAFVFLGKNSCRAVKWLNHPDRKLDEEIITQISRTTKWYLDYTIDPESTYSERKIKEFDMDDKDNRVYLKCLTSDIGKQVLCEAISVLDSVKGPTITANVYFPSIYVKNRVEEEDSFDRSYPEEDGNPPDVVYVPDFVPMFNLYCTFDLDITTLREVDIIINKNLKDVMWRYAQKAALVR